MIELSGRVARGSCLEHVFRVLAGHLTHRSSSLGETAKGLGGMKPDAIDPTAGDLARGVCGGAGLKSDTNKGL
jgi:hypothetical protein